ncbi:MAG: peroxidase family protein [Saprospiraceae bacterium]
MNKIYLIIQFVSLAIVLNGQEYRSIDGHYNNLEHPEWGGAGTLMLTMTSNGFRDSIKSITTNDRPNPRLISNYLCAEDKIDSLDSFKLSGFFWTFMQFIEHDIQKTSFNYSEPYSISIPAEILSCR